MHWFKQCFVVIIAVADSLGEIHFAIYTSIQSDDDVFGFAMRTYSNYNYGIRSNNKMYTNPSVYRSAIIFILIWYFIPFHKLIFSLHTSVLAYSQRTHHQIAPSCCKLAFSRSCVCATILHTLLFIWFRQVFWAWNAYKVMAHSNNSLYLVVFLCVSVSVLETNRVLFVLFFLNRFVEFEFLWQWLTLYSPLFIIFNSFANTLQEY